MPGKKSREGPNPSVPTINRNITEIEMKIPDNIKKSKVLCGFLAAGWAILFLGIGAYFEFGYPVSRILWIAGIVIPYIGVMASWIGYLKKSKDLKERERGAFNIFIFTVAIIITVIILAK